MANSYSQAHRLPDDIDWSVSHRTPPPVPNSQHANQYGCFPSPPNNYYVASAITTDEPEFAPDGARGAYRETDNNRPTGARHDHARSNSHYTSAIPNTTASAGGAALRDTIQNVGNGQHPPNDPRNIPKQSHTFFSGKRSASRDQSSERPTTSAGAATEGGRRRGSFSFLRRNSSSQAHPSSHSNSNDSPAVYISNTAPPPLPVTRIAQAHADAAADPNNRHFRSPSDSINTSRRKTSSEGKRNTSPSMLRKSNRARAQQQAEQERLAREAAAQVPRQPPHIPSLSPLPGITAFGGDDTRQDPHTNNTDGPAYTASPPPPRAANFSRPSAMSTSSYQNSSSSPSYPPRAGHVPSSSPDIRSASSGEYVSIDSRSESITNRGRYSYSSTMAPVNSVNSPRRVRRRKDPTPFNVLVIGAKNSGKTSFISYLQHSLASPSYKQSPNPQESRQGHDHKNSFTSHYLETEIDGERVALTLWDSKGLEQGIVDLQVREMAAFVESKFEETFVEEQKVMRSPGVRDTHIHCVLLLMDPIRLDSSIAGGAPAGPKAGALLGSLDDDLDLQAMRALWGKTTVIPIIAKADTLTGGHMTFLKRAVWQSLKASRLDPLEALELEDDAGGASDPSEAHTEDFPPFHSAVTSPDLAPEVLSPKPKKTHKRHSSLSLNNGTRPSADDENPYLPMSILSPDPYDLPPLASPKPTSTSTSAGPATAVGRRFPWGTASPLDPEHCDFTRLRDSVFAEWRAELRELSRARWYEHWRTSRLELLPRAMQRVRGGVTPVTAVPGGGRSGLAERGKAERGAGGSGGLGTEGRMMGSPPLQPPPLADHPALVAAAMPRSVSLPQGSANANAHVHASAYGQQQQGVGLAVSMGGR